MAHSSNYYGRKRRREPEDEGSRSPKAVEYDEKNRKFYRPLYTPDLIFSNYKGSLTNEEIEEITNDTSLKLYCFGRGAKKPTNYTDENGFYIAVAHDHMQYRYHVFKKFQVGSTANLILVHDMKYNIDVAVKVFRKGEKYEKCYENEVKVLTHLESSDEQGSKCVVKFYEAFSYRGHNAIVLEYLGKDLSYITLRGSGYNETANLRIIANSILEGLKYIHENGIIHGDLKPCNIAFVGNTVECKILDFGSSMFVKDLEDRKHKLHAPYRAPELILDLPFDTKVDIFAFAMILCEIISKQHIFFCSEENEKENLYKYIEFAGMPPTELLKKSRRGTEFFRFEQGEHPSLILDGLEHNYVPRSVPLHALITEAEDKPALSNFILRCMCMDPAKRPSAAELLKHPWIKGTLD